MKISTLLCTALTLMACAWLILAGSFRSQSKKSSGTIADFFVSAFNEDGRPLTGYLVRIDGKLIGKTNKYGMLSKSGLTIGNVATVALTLKSMEFRHEKARETLLTLPATKGNGRLTYSVTSSLCIDFIVCDDDLHTIKFGKSAPVPQSNRSSTSAAALPERYDFNLVRNPELGPKVSAVIKLLDKQIKSDKVTGSGMPVNIKFSHIDSKKHGTMVRVTGKRQASGSVDNDFAFLLPLNEDPAKTAKQIHAFLAETRPGTIAGKNHKIVKLSFNDALNDSYEVYAGGLSGHAVTGNAWNLVVPNSGRFFLTVVNNGKIIARKFFDAGNASQLDFDSK